ncbi:hypothetical protein ACFL0P_06370 [Candidatus Omnitrophota bacterium]
MKIMTRRFCLIRIFISISVIFWSTWTGALPSCAQEQYIAQSFGLYSKGIAYYHEGNLHGAKDVLQRAILLDPRNDDAQGYLDLVNAELRMRRKGKLDFYQSGDEFRRESDFEETEFYSESDPEYEYYEPEDDEFEYRYFGRGDGDPGGYDFEYRYRGEGYPTNKAKAVLDALNQRITGEYKMSIGVTSEDVIWKQANGDYNERNFRMIDHNFPKTNTFDTRVFDRVKVVLDTNQEKGFNFHSDITVDPWSFVGKTDKFIASNTGDWDRVEMELKYWSGTRRIINETYRTLDTGDLVSTSEHKVSNGRVPSFSVTGDWEEWGVKNNNFIIPEQDINFIFQPVRELWFDYNTDNYNFRVFPLGLEDQALSSDDPLGLSNHHMYWEPSPWLDDWVPGHLNSTANPVSYYRGEWSDDLSFFTRDSDLKRLTALRGFSFQGDLSTTTNLSFTVAAPKGLWQDYGSVTALPGALRTKTQMTDRLMGGLIGTFRIGYGENQHVDSYNNVIGGDLSYDLSPTTNIAAEIATSKSKDDKMGDIYKTQKNGTAAHIAIKKETGLGNMKLAFTHMDEAFDPGLASYKETRRDLHWSRHIQFKKPFEESVWGTGALKYHDIEPFRIGDGIDVGRKVLNFRLDADGERMDNLIDYRYVRGSENKYVEGVFREENTFKINPRWTSKLLFIYHDLPKTKGGIDPIQYDTDTGEFLKVPFDENGNGGIEDGKDPSISTYSFGLEYEPDEWISVFGIYENTNDYKFSTGNHPSGLLTDPWATEELIEGQWYRKEVPALYSQGFFDLPPYERFHIYRTGVSLRPTENLGIDFDYTKNDFKFAAGIDDNINHFGTTLKYKFNPKMTGYLKYTFSKAYNLYRLITSGDLKYEDHHNVFIELDYNVSEYGLLTIQFGEGSVVSPVWGATASPFGDFYPTLDTQHILRVYYQGRF